MSSEVPLLTLEQVGELSYIVAGIQQQNKKKLEETLGEQVQISNTSILGLYRLVTEEWAKKQKIVDNLCHFARSRLVISVTMMSTVQFLWQQREIQNERLQTAENTINSLQKELDEAIDLNQLFKQKISEAETHIQSITDAKARIQEYVRSQSCTDFSGEMAYDLECSINQKRAASKEHHRDDHQEGEINARKDQTAIEISEEIENLREQKKKLEMQLEEAIEEKQLTKMELQLAQIAIKDALTYKTSFRSLVQSSSSNLEDRLRMQSNIHYYHQEGDYNSLVDESFNDSNRNVLSNEFTCREDIIHFASTPCLLLNDSINKINLDNSLSSLRKDNQQTTPENPFKKKLFEDADKTPLKSSRLKKKQDLNISIEDIYQKMHRQDKQGHNKTLDLKCESRISSSQNVGFNQQAGSMMADERMMKGAISRMSSCGQKMEDKSQTYQSSLMSSAPVSPVKKSKFHQQKDQLRSTVSSEQGSITKFYNFVTKKVIKSRIKVK